MKLLGRQLAVLAATLADATSYTRRWGTGLSEAFVRRRPLTIAFSFLCGAVYCRMLTASTAGSE